MADGSTTGVWRELVRNFGQRKARGRVGLEDGSGSRVQGLVQIAAKLGDLPDIAFLFEMANLLANILVVWSRSPDGVGVGQFVTPVGSIAPVVLYLAHFARSASIKSASI